METSSKIEVRGGTNLNDNLQEFARKGVIRIPHFQRDYVWEPKRVKDLLDSIYRKFPIGTFFYWIPPSEYSNLYKDLPQLELPQPDPHTKIKLVLDGQQRLTSLHCVARGLTIERDGKKPRDYKKICFDLDKKEFVVTRLGENKSRYISVHRLFDQELIYEIYDNLSEQRRRALNECQIALTTYPLSIVEVEGKSLEEAIVIFERINQGGKRLNLFDLVVASTWSTNFDLKDKITELNKHFESRGFGKLDEEIVTQTLALVIKGICTKSFQLQLTNQEIVDGWKEVENGLKLAVDFVSENLGVRVNDFMPYPAMLSLIAYMFIKNEGRSLSATQRQFLEQWFWRATFSQRYSSSTLTLLSQDRVGYFDPAIEGAIVSVDYPLTVTLKGIASLRIHTSSAIKNGILCLLSLRSPQHFRNGSPVVLDRSICSSYNDVEKHHIFPRAFLERSEIKDTRQLVNFTFLPAELNNEIRDQEPSAYFANYQKENPNFADTLKSHFIPSDEQSPIWSNNYENFVEMRAAMFMQEIERVTGVITDLEQQVQDEPDAAIKHLEKSLRSFIDTKLTDSLGAEWWSSVPQDIRNAVEQKTGYRHKRHPGESKLPMTSFQLLTYCDIMDYQKIIQMQWPTFEYYFASKGEIEKHFADLKEFRNVLAHAGEMTSVIRKRGEASFEWLAKIISHEYNATVSQINEEEEVASDDEEASRSFMEALTASDDAHREAMRKVADLRDNESGEDQKPS